MERIHVFRRVENVNEDGGLFEIFVKKVGACEYQILGVLR